MRLLPCDHRYSPGSSLPGALTNTISASSVANSTSTSSRAEMVQALAIDGKGNARTMASKTRHDRSHAKGFLCSKLQSCWWGSVGSFDAHFARAGCKDSMSTVASEFSQDHARLRLMRATPLSCATKKPNCKTNGHEEHIRLRQMSRVLL